MTESVGWRDSLRNLLDLAERLSEPRYRFDLPYVRISAIAEQYSVSYTHLTLPTKA